MNKNEYLQQFSSNVHVAGDKRKVEKALEVAMEIRNFEIELYWKRATYFWALIGAAFVGYGVVFAADNHDDKSWLLLVFSCLGLLFSVAWYLVNRGSKFWQNNWERHVDLLEDDVIGPLYKTVAHGSGSNCFLTGAKQYSVSKINQMLSLFVALFWVLLIIKSLLPISCSLAPDCLKILILAGTAAACLCLFCCGKAEIKKTKCELSKRELIVKS